MFRKVCVSWRNGRLRRSGTGTGACLATCEPVKPTESEPSEQQAAGQTGKIQPIE